jgi:hypothetical protein
VKKRNQAPVVLFSCGRERSGPTPLLSRVPQFATALRLAIDPYIVGVNYVTSFLQS